uniref:Uncharacterized protein n=1 Tax=Onchocerca volvulus TaxID=6282 RepID=A0A8R1TJU2_ONCVO
MKSEGTDSSKMFYGNIGLAEFEKCSLSLSLVDDLKYCKQKIFFLEVQKTVSVELPLTVNQKKNGQIKKRKLDVNAGTNSNKMGLCDAINYIIDNIINLLIIINSKTL